jgi:hypothetical protein
VDPFFAEIRPVFHGGQFHIFGDLLLFLVEVVESGLPKLDGGYLLFIDVILM